jgi:hypothetical protein
MKEQLTTLETATLAKEKDFNWICNAHHNERDGFIIPEEKTMVSYKNYNIFHLSTSIPTQALLQRWLREVHQLYVEVNIEMIVRNQEVFDVAVFSKDTREENDFGVIRLLKITGNKSFESALEIGLQEAVKAI